MRSPLKLDRSIRLNLQGDWGQANFHRVCGWISQEVVDHSGPFSRVAIWNGRGMADAPLAIQEAAVDLAISTPDRFALMALRGIGPFEGRPVADLRALAVLPQYDRLVFAVRADLGIRTFAELRQRAPGLRIAASIDDGVNYIGFAAQRVMEASDVSRSRLHEWGGRYLEFERPDACLASVQKGEADAVIQEAIMSVWWSDLMREQDMVMVPFEPQALESVSKTYDWTAGALPRGYFAGHDESVSALDYSDFSVLVSQHMADDVAYFLTRCIVEQRAALERQYHHIPADRSPVGYPLDPKAMARPAVPLHAAAERYYREAGWL